MISILSHIALLVPSVENSAKYLNNLGIESAKPETFESEGTKEVYVGSYQEQCGLLLLVEALSEGPYRNALIKRGPGLHHIAVDVLDLNKFSEIAQNVGWKLHPITSETISFKTAWFYIKGLPTLLEVHQKKEVLSNPLKVSKLELPVSKEQLVYFKQIGLGEIVVSGKEVLLTVDSLKLQFNQIACL